MVLTCGHSLYFPALMVVKYMIEGWATRVLANVWVDLLCLLVWRLFMCFCNMQESVANSHFDLVYKGYKLERCFV